MSEEEKRAALDEEFEELMKEIKQSATKPACPINKRDREACASCEG
jgi:hypothetical protein